ncbi:MAG: hypothetical protein J0L92_40490 [Deltaproteobacteria bacterium]|nr:hypothetical protein [Deltaproteobacteria bacterium]
MSAGDAHTPAGRNANVRHARFVLAVIALGLLTWGLSIASPSVPWPIETSPLAARGAFVLAFVWVSIECLAGATLAPEVAPRRLILTGLVGALAMVGLALGGVSLSPLTTALVGVLLVLAGSSAGAWVGGRIQHAGHLGVVAVVSSIADAASVLQPSGPTAQILESAPTLSFLTLGAPMLGTADVPPILGVGDVVMSALYVAAARKHQLAQRRTWIALAAGLAAAMTVVLVLELPLPALPFLGVAILVAHPEARLPPPKERVQAAIGVAILLAIVAYVFLRG